MADPFQVWGRPPKGILAKLTHDQQNALRRYIEGVTKKCYRIAFDCGAQRGIDTVRDAANAVEAAQRAKRR